MNWRLARFATRAAVLLASVAAAVPWYLAVNAEPPLDRIALLHWVSPHLALGGALGGKALLVSLLISLPVVTLAMWTGRWFCRWLCPVGLLADGCSTVGKRLLRQRPLRLSPPSRILLAATLGGAVLGFPWFLLLDPLSLLSGALAACRPQLTLVGAVACAALAIPLLAGLVWPGVWCQQICPLGATQDLLGSAGRRCRTARSKPPMPQSEGSWALSRRFLVGAGLAALAGGVVRLFLHTRRQRVVRPPGAVDEDTFVALCARCGACTRACPAGIIVPDGGSAGAHGLLAPKLVFGPGHCEVNCHVCTRVCPTGAIRRLDLPGKSRMLAGRAEVRADGCLAKEGQPCMVCRDCCPYEAVNVDHPTGFGLPAIDVDLCRGCGLCALMCPGDPGTILIAGHAHQRPTPRAVRA